MLELVQIICLDLEVFVDLIRLLLKLADLLPIICELHINTLCLSIQFCFTFFSLPIEVFSFLGALLDKHLYLTNQLLTLVDYFSKQLQLMAIGKLEVAIDTDGVRVRIRLGQTPFHLTVVAD